jgi:hypothetical protein
MELILMWLLGILLGFSSVGSVDHAESSEPVPEPSAAASPVIDPVQERFLARSPLTSCGDYEVEHGFYEQAAQPGWQCLEKAAHAKGAEARFSATGIGTAPVDTFVRVADGVMEIYVHDPATDPYAAWTYDICSVDEASFRQGCP